MAALLCAACLSFVAPSALAWGCKGHETVAYVAERHLNPHALAAANQLLKSNPVDPKLPRFCQEAFYNLMADAATWADDERNVRPETGDWHFIDIPRGAAPDNIGRFCPPDGCVTRAIVGQLQILRTPGADPQQRADALRFLIHFVGDLHQPLHAATNDDRGGNCVPVDYFGLLPARRDPTTENYAPNLHGVWDTNILERMADGVGPQELARELDEQFQPQAGQWQQPVPVNSKDLAQLVDGWAWESHVIAEQTTYGRLPTLIPVEPPQDVNSCADDNNIAERMLKLNEDLEQPYQDASVPVIRGQLEKAGIRLALLLNQVWP